MKSQSELSRQLLLLEEKLLQPDIRKSVKGLEAIIADDFIELGSSGRTYNKQQMIDVLPTLPLVELNLTDFQVKPLSAGVVLTIYRAAKNSIKNDRTEYSLRSSIWILQEGEWRIVFHQGTPSTAEHIKE